MGRTPPKGGGYILTAAMSATRSTVREECYTRAPVLIENLPGFGPTPNPLPAAGRPTR